MHPEIWTVDLGWEHEESMGFACASCAELLPIGS